MKALITTIPFAEKNELPLKLLEEAGVDYLINPTGKKYTEEELADVITDFNFIVAGTEPITEHVMNQAKDLKLIARVGIGLDSVEKSPNLERYKAVADGENIALEKYCKLDWSQSPELQSTFKS